MGQVKETVSRSGYHKRAVKHRKAACELCGGTEDLDAHHKDLDITNDDSTNIQTLCHPCHMKWHHASGTRPRKAKEVCSVSNCNSPSRRNGLCQKHYFRVRRHGSTDTVLQERGY